MPNPRVARKHIKEGAHITLRFYNTPEQCFYGDIKHAQILEVKLPSQEWDKKSVKAIKVMLESGYKMWIHHYEVMRVISHPNS